MVSLHRILSPTVQVEAARSERAGMGGPATGTLTVLVVLQEEITEVSIQLSRTCTYAVNTPVRSALARQQAGRARGALRHMQSGSIANLFGGQSLAECVQPICVEPMTGSRRDRGAGVLVDIEDEDG